MRKICPAFALTIVASFALAGSALAGGQARPYTPPNPRALSALQQDLVSALESMRSALPIYDGNRARAIKSAHEALVIVDRAISGAHALVRKAPVEKDSVASGSAKANFSQEQLSASQASMQRGYAALQQAWQDLQTAAGSNPNAKAIKVANHLKLAGSEASKAISLHPGQS